MIYPEKKPNVGVFLFSSSIEGSGGTERRFARIFRCIQEQKHHENIFLITNSEMPTQLEMASIYVGSRNVIIKKIDMPSKRVNFFFRYFNHLKYSIKHYFLLKKIIKKYKIDILHFISPNLYFIPFMLLKRRKPRLVLSLVSYVAFLEEIPWKDKLVWRFFFEKSDLIDSLYCRFKEFYPKYKKKTRIAPCSFTDYTQFFPADRKENLVIFSGRLESRKNPLLFVETASLISEFLRKEDWKFIVLGKGELEIKLREFIRKNDIEDILTIQSISDTSSILRRSSIFVSLQEFENYPSQALLEAMAAENAIIATDVGETRRLINNNNGILLEEQSAVALSQAVILLIENTQLRKKLGENARKSIINTHKIDLYANYLKELWLELS